MWENTFINMAIMTKSFKIINSLDGMIFKGMDKCPNNTGRYLLLCCHWMLQAWHFWSEVGKASQAFAELPETLFSIKACIMSAIPQPLSAKQILYNSTGWLHNRAWLCRPEWAHNEPEEVVLVFSILLFKGDTALHHAVAKEQSHSVWDLALSQGVL